MLNIVVLRDGLYVEYEWNSTDEFIYELENCKDIPNLDDVLAEVNTDDEEIHLWWRDTGCNTVGDLYEKIKKM